jgi:hypothetical protein
MEGFMNGQLLRTGLLAGPVGIVWTILSFGLIPLRNTMGWKEVPNEEVVLEALDANLTEAGLYLVPGHSPPDSLFRSRHADGPFFRVHSLPNGTEGPVRSLVSILSLLLAPLIPAWFLFGICQQGTPSYPTRVFIVTLFGVFLTLTGEIQLWGLELYPLLYSLLLSANAILSWLVIGLFLAWRIKPAGAVPRGSTGPAV